jgi:uncharacterized protein (DUF2164 family)
MAVTLQDEARKHALASLKRFMTEQLDAEVSDLQAIGLLEFFLKEIGPSAYNAGVADAQAYLRDRLEDLGAPATSPSSATGPNQPRSDGDDPWSACAPAPSTRRAGRTPPPSFHYL